MLPKTNIFQKLTNKNSYKETECFQKNLSECTYI